MDCPEEGFNNGKCIIYKQKYKDRKLFISWFNGINGKGVDYLSINSDKSGFLLMELSISNHFSHIQLYCNNNKYRKIYFFDDEGRGLINSINHEYEKTIVLNEAYCGFISTSNAIKINNDNEYTFLLNFENNQGYLELINLRTAESTCEKLKILTSEYGTDIAFGDKSIPSMFILELEKENHYLLGFFTPENLAKNEPKGIGILEFTFISTEDKPKIDINSFYLVQYLTLKGVEPSDSRISYIQLKSGNIVVTYLRKGNYLFGTVLDIENIKVLCDIQITDYLEDYNFFKK